MANHEWRKKPRKFAPKSRLGCKTCKIRRIKCDQSRPSCDKCRSTGRICDGYSPSSFFAVDLNLDGTGGTIIQNMHRHMPPSLGPLLALPTAGPAQDETMHFFEHVSVLHVDEYYPSEPWRNTIMLFSQTAPPVRHAALALALMHRSYRHQAVSPSLEHSPLFHYNRAIQLLLQQPESNSPEATAITLLTCYLFICFDHLARNYVQAIKHLHGGVHLAQSITSASMGRANTSPAIQVLISQLKREMRRLDLQAVTFLVDWKPLEFLPAEDLDAPPSLRPRGSDLSWLPTHNGAFTSLDEAADALQPLVSKIMCLRNLEQQRQITICLPSEEDLTPSPPPPSPPPASQLQTLSRHLQTWSTLFENTLLLQKKSPPSPTFIPLLRLHHTLSHILLNTHYSPEGEMSYDLYTPQFKHCLSLAKEVTTSGNQTAPILTPSVGTIPVLYIIAAKCRHPGLRREALGLLRRGVPVREAVWDGEIAARVVERVIEIEEGRGAQEDMEMEIQMWRRVEMMTWVHHPGEDGERKRLDLRYSFCGRERWFEEVIFMEEGGLGESSEGGIRREE
ncbi:hypothetical protein B0T14DRAFT_487311 [Immersiella caudata]|uniref:Zn(2)-C6 fungal-type domain-containing protein n=1 Tax=Immersiella caudata TaxID=314043 RepID=A0AA39U4K7_9PEZI|nr:hypothetical protein B0T14DRAFT_487311 [Immersiella caudata]